MAAIDLLSPQSTNPEEPDRSLYDPSLTAVADPLMIAWARIDLSSVIWDRSAAHRSAGEYEDMISEIVIEWYCKFGEPEEIETSVWETS